MRPAAEPARDGDDLGFLRLNLRWALTRLELKLAARAADADAFARLAAENDALVAELERLGRDGKSRFFRLAERARLNALESQVMGLCLAQTMEPRVGTLLGELHGRAGARPLTVGDVASLLTDDDVDARVQLLAMLSARSTLRAARILESPRLEWNGLFDTALYLTRACVLELLGQPLESPVFRVCREAHRSGAGEPRYAVIDTAVADQVLDALKSFSSAIADSGSRDFVLLLFWGPSGAGKTLFARELGQHFFGAVIELDAAALLQAPDVAAALREAFDAAAIHSAMIVVENGQVLGAAEPAARLVLDELAGCPTCLVVTSTIRDLGPTLEGSWSLAVHVPRLPRDNGAELWRSHLTPELVAGVDLDSLAERYHLSGAQVARAARLALARAAAAPERGLDLAALEAAAAAQLDADMGQLVQTIYPSHVLDDLVLPPEDLEQINELIEAYRNWHHVMGGWGLGRRLATGKCISALFYGEPGTGKSFAAEVIASAAGQPLHIVSLPNVLSKWMGETERNIHDIFERGRLNNAILLFDEADALFSSRVEVRSAQDHGMNMMTGQLLQELDRHTGLVVMTTNLTENIDAAFKRRILFTLEFAKPDQEMRRRIWERLLPAEMPRADDVDLDELAQHFALSGGEIKNAVLRASLAAFSSAGLLTRELLLQACEREYRHTGRLLHERQR